MNSWNLLWSSVDIPNHHFIYWCSFFLKVTCYLQALFLRVEDLTFGLNDLKDLFQPKQFNDFKGFSHFINTHIYLHTVTYSGISREIIFYWKETISAENQT